MVCQGNINSPKYVSILHEGLFSIFSRGHMNKHDALFMEAGAACHRSKATKSRLELQRMKLQPLAEVALLFFGDANIAA